MKLNYLTEEYITEVVEDKLQPYIDVVRGIGEDIKTLTNGLVTVSIGNIRTKTLAVRLHVAGSAEISSLLCAIEHMYDDKVKIKLLTAGDDIVTFGLDDFKREMIDLFYDNQVRYIIQLYNQELTAKIKAEEEKLSKSLVVERSGGKKCSTKKR